MAVYIPRNTGTEEGWYLLKKVDIVKTWGVGLASLVSKFCGSVCWGLWYVCFYVLVFSRWSLG
jgi:FtsH-binding integral membrane protein